MRQLLPRPDTSGQQHSGEPARALRKPPRDQVPMACDACRKRKSKCDRRRPQCVQCVLSSTCCHFSAPRVPAAHNPLPSGELHSFLDLIRRGSIDESKQLLDRLRQAPSTHDFIESFFDARRPMPEASRTISLSSDLPATETCPYVPLCFNGLLPSIEPFTISTNLTQRFPDGLLPISQWTALSIDNRYLTHLLNLFFAWDGALSNTIHRTAFLGAIKSPEASETPNVCSKFLMHSLIAVSHIYLSQGNLRSQIRELRSRGREFADEALRILDQDRLCPSIPLAQGLVLLWTHEVNHGNENLAIALLDEFYRVTDALSKKYNSHSEMPDGRDWQSPSDTESTAFAFWGLFCLEAKLALTFSRTMRISRPRLPKPSTRSTLATMATSATSGAAENFWFPYPEARPPQPSYVNTVITYECELAELTCEASPFFALTEANAPCPDYHAVKAMYNELLAWNRGAVQEFLLSKALLPSALFVDVTFQMIQVKLLACLSRCDPSEINLQAIISTGASHGAAIISSLSAYRAAYGVRHEFWLAQACFVGLIAVLYGRGANHGLSKPIVIACELLLSIGNYLPVANEYLWSIKALARRLEIVLPKTCARIFSMLAAREGRTILKNVKLADLGPSQTGTDIGVPSRLPCNFTFSEYIECFRLLE